MTGSSLSRYGVALLSAAVACLLAGWLTRVGYGASHVFLAAVVVSAWYGGLAPGLMVTLLAVVVLEILPSPPSPLDQREAGVLRAGLFLLVALLISSLNAANRRLARALRDEYRRKDEFLSVLAHELRNPLGALLNAARVLRGSASDAAAVILAAGVIERRARHMNRLVNDLLDASRIRQGKLQLQRRRVDLAAVVREAVEATRFLIDQNHQTLAVAVPAGRFFVDGDPTRLEQVVANLLTNAAKFTPTGGHIQVEAGSAPGEVLLRVGDDGLGIAADVLPRIFEMHAQARNGCQGGLGIGLSLVRGLVALHGGHVTAASLGPGRGSEFLVHLPALPLEPDRAARVSDSAV